MPCNCIVQSFLLPFTKDSALVIFIAVFLYWIPILDDDDVIICYFLCFEKLILGYSLWLLNLQIKADNMYKPGQHIILFSNGHLL